MIDGIVTSEKIDEIIPALVEAQKGFAHPEKSKEGRSGNQTYNYADLPATIDAVRGPLNEQGIVLLTATSPAENGVGWIISAAIVHTSGQWIASSLPIDVAVPPKELGSEMTYKRRYLTACVTMIASEDDDDAARKDGKKKPPADQKKKSGGQQPTAKSDFVKSTQKLFKDGISTLAELGDGDADVTMTAKLDSLLETHNVAQVSDIVNHTEQENFYRALVAFVNDRKKELGSKPLPGPEPGTEPDPADIVGAGDFTATRLDPPSKPSNFASRYIDLRESFLSTEGLGEAAWHSIAMTHLGAAGFESIAAIAKDTKARATFLSDVTSVANDRIAEANGL